MPGVSGQQKDNSTGELKAILRSRVLGWLRDPPVIMETNGGEGVMYNLCYMAIEHGIVFEKDKRKARILAHQRPTWSVWAADNVRAIQSGVGSHLTVNFLDVDPYGSSWDIIEAFFASSRPRTRQLVVVVNDGLRKKMQTDAWRAKVTQKYLLRYGNSGLFPRYLEIARDMLRESAAGYQITKWYGYYCGFQNNNTHFAALLER